MEHYYIHFIPQLTGGKDLFKLLEFNFEIPASVSDTRLIKKIFKLNPGKKLINQDPAKYCKSDLLPGRYSPASPLQIASFIETQGILLQLFSRFIKTGAKATTKTSNQQDPKIQRVIEYIQENLSKPISIGELASICHLSNDYFSRLFLKIMGTRPIDYINRKRIEEAQLQLLSTNDPIEKIALEVGIDNFSYFNRLFKKYSCNTPGEYRRLHRLV